MAANKFATMLHRNSNKLTVILIYAVLEWILIVLLLLNSLFSYLIIRFADYFGLKTPCLWCSRLDHIFEPGKNKNSHRDLLCEAHAAEISKLGYCSNHRKLAESQEMCEDCSSSRPDYRGASKNLSFFPWVKEIGMIENEGDKVSDENGDVGFKCSCCGVNFHSKIYSPYIVIKPSWGVLEYTQKVDLNDDDDQIEDGDNSDRSGSDFVIDRCQDDHAIEENDESQMLCGVRDHEEDVDCSVSVSNSGLGELDGDEIDRVVMALESEKEPIKEDNSVVIMEDPSSGEALNQIFTREDESVEIPPQHLEFFVGHGGYRLIPVELIDSTMEENRSTYRSKEEDDVNFDNREENLESKSRDEARVESVGENLNRSRLGEREAELSANEMEEEAKFAVFESMEIEENDNSLIFHAKECDFVREVYEHVEADAEERDSDVPPVTEEVFQMPVNEIEAEVSIGTEIPDLEPTDEIQNQEILCINEDPSISSAVFQMDESQGSKQAEEESVELKTISIEVREIVMNNEISLGSELNEIEEEKVPDTPTSIENLHHLHKKLLLLEKRELGTEESLDGSVISEFESGDGVTSIEHLKSALRSERKALHALYAELEEERSSSAVAASQTMAMINRLQEEKAAMQMEALQYQRMMEEQSEYDQEALQLLNELMVKREKEKQELEKGLEVYRKKVLEYEGKEKMRMLRKSKDCIARSESCSASSSSVGDSDGLSIDLNQEAKEEDRFDRENGNHNTPIDEVLNLEESLANFEEERLSILEQLKVLEEKLFTLSDEEEQHFEDIKPIEHFYEENGNGDLGFGGEGVNGIANANGFSKQMNGKHHIIGAKGKTLLPLFDAISTENGDTFVENGHVNGYDYDILKSPCVKRNELENKKLVEEEVDHLYERLQALEADREFLKHCMSSLKKGDKGMDLLQEILQHLRDLRNVELRLRNFGDTAQIVFLECGLKTEEEHKDRDDQMKKK
ncbi:unnamed protein product [Camellia sinensis]